VAYVGYAICAIALAGLLIFGPVTRGARGWIPLGPINLQPAEFMKIAFVLALARWLSFSKDLDSYRGMIVPVLLAVLPVALVFLQPDLGNAMLFFPVLLAMCFVAGASRRWILTLVLVAAVAVPVGYVYGMKDYQRNRVTAFLRPNSVAKEFTYQQVQAERSIGSGGVAGRGDVGARHPFYVPDRHTDFVFSVIAEEAGFIGSTFALLLFAVFFIQAGRVAHRTAEPYGRLVVIGLTAFCGLQVFVNVGMNVGMAPITGLTLPFVSYGGSSLLTCFLSLAGILHVDARWIPTFSSRDLDRGHGQIREFLRPSQYWLGGAAR